MQIGDAFVDQVVLLLKLVVLDEFGVGQGDGDVVADERQVVDVGVDIHALNVFKAHFELVDWLFGALAQWHLAFVGLMLGEELDGEMFSIEPGFDALDDVNRSVFEADQDHVVDVH